jgi:hypothetical protein
MQASRPLKRSTAVPAVLANRCPRLFGFVGEHRRKTCTMPFPTAAETATVQDSRDGRPRNRAQPFSKTDLPAQTKRLFSFDGLTRWSSPVLFN